MNSSYHAPSAYPSSGQHAQSQQQPSAPLYMDLLSDDSYYYNATATQPPNIVTPTANAVYMSSSSPTVANFPPSTSQATRTSSTATNSHNEDKVVMIPSNSVFIEQQNLHTAMSTSSNVNHATTTTLSPSSLAPVYSYNDNNTYHREEETSPYTNSNNYYNSNDHDYTNNETAIATLHDPDHSQRYFNGKPVKAKNAHLPDSVLAFKAERKRRTVMATCTGGAVGLIALGPVLGPVGAVIGATSAYAAAKTVGKHRERKITEHAILQQNYLSSSIRDENAVPSSTDIVQQSSGTSQYYASAGNNVRSMANIPIDRAEVA